MAIQSDNLAHAHSQLIELFLLDGSKVVTACNDDSGILWIALFLSQSYSGHANEELALPSIVQDALQIV